MTQTELPHDQVPASIKLFPNIISHLEEEELLSHLKHLHWRQVKMHGIVAKRQVIHFGLDYNFTKRGVRPTDSAPAFLHSSMGRAAELLQIKTEDIAEVLVTHYPPGAAIGWHKDAPIFGDAIAGLSLKGSCTMKFRREGHGIYKLNLPPRGIYVFKDEARWLWQHTIPSHKEERFSITFRTLKKS